MSDNAERFEFEDMQGLMQFGYGKLTETCFLLLKIADAAAAKKWLATLPVSNAVEMDVAPATALQIAFTVQGLCALNVDKDVIAQFAYEFIQGMAGNDSRSRRLGDIGTNTPNKWEWGGCPEHTPHVLLLLYAARDKLADLRQQVEGNDFAHAFTVVRELPTNDNVRSEPFGFRDGISQPDLDWQQQHATGATGHNQFSNVLAVGEVVLGYANEYGQYTARPLIDPGKDAHAGLLANALDKPGLKDFARNGTFLVLRQLYQDVPAFWQFADKAANGDAVQRDQLAAAMVGRHRDGTPLVALAQENIPGIASDDQLNRITYDQDPSGVQCPLGSHIRRSNPRTADLTVSAGESSWQRFLKLLGFKQQHFQEDLVASTRFHRLLRRGRSYGPSLTPEDAIKHNAREEQRGLQFICLVANIQRQFEFVQNAWMVNSKFNGTQQERDPLLGHREQLMGGQPSDCFSRPHAAGPRQIVCHLPQFITVRGGAYFFMPGLRVLKYLAALPNHGS